MTHEPCGSYRAEINFGGAKVQSTSASYKNIVASLLILVDYVGFSWNSLVAELKLWSELQAEMKVYST